MQEETIKFLTEYKKYQVLWWGFGPTLLEDLCREKNFDVTELLAKKDKYQCAELLMAFGDRKKYWWWPWSKKITDTTFNKTTCRWAFEYHQYSWFWRVIFGLFTPVLLHRQVLKWINIKYGGYMYRSNNQTIIKSYLTIAADFNTVGGTLKSLGFPELLQQLDDSLEMVRKHIKTEEQHRKFVAGIEREMNKLSLKIHPDRVMNRGGSARETAEADKKQTALNACKALITNTSEFFLDYIPADFKYECYNKMTINSLGVINLLNVRFLAKLGPISRIKQEEIITYTHKFLQASRSSLEQFIASRSYEGHDSDMKLCAFEQHRSDALHYLILCIKGYENLQEQCDNVRGECVEDAELQDFLYDSISDISCKNTEQLKQLYKLKEFADNAFQGKIGIIEMRGMDEYMVWPFAMYIGALALCSNAPAGKKSEDISCLWWVVVQTFSFFASLCNIHSIIPTLLSSSFFSPSMMGTQQENLNRLLINSASYLGAGEEINVNQVVDSIVTLSYKLAQKFNLDHYKPITVAFYLEESRELAERIEVFTKKVAEDLERAREILQDQEEIGKDFEKIRQNQEKIREGFLEISKDLDKLSKDQDKLNEDQDEFSGEMQDFEANFRVWAEQLQNTQPQPSSSLSGVEPKRHSQSMSRD